VSRIYRWVGVPGALLMLPVIAAIGLWPDGVHPDLFDDSGSSESREQRRLFAHEYDRGQALFFAGEPRREYDGKTAIEPFSGVRRLIQAGVVYAGLHRGTGRSRSSRR